MITKNLAIKLKKAYTPSVSGKSFDINELKFFRTPESGAVYRCDKKICSDPQSGAIYCGDIAEYIAIVKTESDGKEIFGSIALCEYHGRKIDRNNIIKQELPNDLVSSDI